MHYERLGRSGLVVSRICLGTMMFGDQTPARTSGRIIATAREAGVNFIDTADTYCHGETERIVGRFLRGDRDHWILATKCGSPMSKAPNESGLGRKWIRQALHGSLGRLGTDYVDILYFHRPDPKTPLEESARAVFDLIREGKVRYWGLSNVRGWQIADAVRVAERLGGPGPVVVQPYYNAVNRQPEVEVLPACGHYGIGVAPYSPVARGVLAGVYVSGRRPPSGTRVARKEVFVMLTEYREESLELAQRIRAHAERRGMSTAQFAFNWVLNNRLVNAAIAGPRTMKHWADYLGALEHPFTAEDEAFVDSLVPAGHPSTPGYADPRYPVTGRVPRARH